MDSRIAGLEAEVARLPKQIAAIHAALDEAKKTWTASRPGSTPPARTSAPGRKTSKSPREAHEGEARLYQVKTNKEYSAVLVEIEEVKQEKARIEEEILGLMEPRSASPPR